MIVHHLLNVYPLITKDFFLLFLYDYNRKIPHVSFTVGGKGFKKFAHFTEVGEMN